MNQSTVDEVVVDEKIWRAWVQKGQVGEKATARNMKVVVIAVVVALAIAFYLLAVR